MSLKRVLQSDSLSSSASLQIKLAEHSKHSESSSSSLLHDTSGPSVDRPFTGIVCGPLLVSYSIMFIHDLFYIPYMTLFYLLFIKSNNYSNQIKGGERGKPEYLGKGERKMKQESGTMVQWPLLKAGSPWDA